MGLQEGDHVSEGVELKPREGQEDRGDEVGTGREEVDLAEVGVVQGADHNPEEVGQAVTGRVEAGQTDQETGQEEVGGPLY